MTAKNIQFLIQSWETVRYELLNTRVSDLKLQIKGSPVEPFVQRLYRELEAKRMRFRPHVYLTESWGCPDRTPVIGVPFYLADRRLARLEEEQNGEVEDAKMIMMLLRHENGHAVNYAYRLWERPSWEQVFGPFSRPYRDVFRPDRLSRHFVRHIDSQSYGRTYAQKHPDEDFAETFAVWLTPRSEWRRRYRHWPAIRKLRYVEQLMKEVRNRKPLNSRKRLVLPVEKMTYLVADHYGKKAERFRMVARGYVDDKLKEVFPEVRGKSLVPAARLIRQSRKDIADRIVRWSRLEEKEVEAILKKLESRSESLGLQFRHSQSSLKAMDLVVLATSLAMDYAYTGRLTG